MDENVRVLFEWFSQSYDAFVSGKVSVDYRISEHDGNFLTADLMSSLVLIYSGSSSKQ